YVLRREGGIRWKELGEASQIDKAIESLREALRDPLREDVKGLARKAYARIFQPIQPFLPGMTRLLISPDSLLNVIPFEVLIDQQGRYLVQRYSISYLTSGRDLLRLQIPRDSKGGPLIIADPDFGRRSQGTMAQLAQEERGAPEVAIQDQRKWAASTFREYNFLPLPYSAQEGKTLRELLPEATLLTRREATKTALSQVRSPSLLHIATHGFFLEGSHSTGPGLRSHGKSEQLHESGEISTENPLLRSGLVLAGANEQREDDNGIMTALEMTGLDLWGTRLVVLSACDTGIGEVKVGDGIHGLRRALVLAGAESQVISLWAISDKATRDLMIGYYRLLKQGEGRGDALRKEQLKMLKSMNWGHPHYWACFIQSGEWANLAGRR
ncbi:MAG: CHAT domain-containing protein, partial [Blastocatellia bacterium]|nr:CHAT domain-containing protein [Blastocatellia bacterium]